MGARNLKLATYVFDEHQSIVWFQPGDDVPDWAAKQITNPDAWENGADDVDEQDDGDKPKPYLERLKADLEAEIASRNDSRDDDDQIVVGGTGSKKDLAAALEADDEANSGSGD